MSLRKVEKLVGSELDSILQDTGEYKSFALGYAYGCYSFYKNTHSQYGAEAAKKCFEGYLEGNDKYCEYFKRLIEADEEPDTKADMVFKKMRGLRGLM